MPELELWKVEEAMAGTRRLPEEPMTDFFDRVIAEARQRTRPEQTMLPLQTKEPGQEG